MLRIPVLIVIQIFAMTIGSGIEKDGYSDNPELHEVRRIALASLETHKPNLENKRSFYQLPADLDLGSATLASPIPLYLLQPDLFPEAAGDEIQISNCSRFLDTWIFPVKFGDNPGLLQWVSRAPDGTFISGAFGMWPLALKLHELTKRQGETGKKIQVFTIPRYPRFYYAHIEGSIASTLAGIDQVDPQSEDFPTPSETLHKIKALFANE